MLIDGKQIKDASIPQGAIVPVAVGITGPRGVTGAQGITGIRGITGIDFTTQGITGKWNLTGIWGITGLQGITGRQGITGSSGQNISIAVITWNQSYQTGVPGLQPIAVASGIDGFRVMPRFGTIVDVFMTVQQNGGTATTIGNILAGTGVDNAANTPWTVVMSSIFADANRPMINFASVAARTTNASVKAPAVQSPWSAGFSKGDVFGASCDSGGGTARGLCIQMVVAYTGS